MSEYCDAVFILNIQTSQLLTIFVLKFEQVQLKYYLMLCLKIGG